MSGEKEVFKEIGARLRRFRKTVLGLSQAELAVKIGLKRSSSVSKLENGDQKIDISTLEKYASLANKSSLELMQEGELHEDRASDLHLLSVFRGLNDGDKKIAEMFFEILIDRDSSLRRELKGFIFEVYEKIGQNKTK